MEEKQFLVILFLNDNHLSNVKTLQSIYKQDYPNIYLLACNDCTDAFQCERFIYNFEAGRGKNIRRIYLHENRYPLGELHTQRLLMDKVNSDYVIVLHSGEYFVTNDVLSKCVEIMENDQNAVGVLMNVELWTNDMKKCISKHNVFSKNEYRASMAVYRLEMLKSILNTHSTEEEIEKSGIIQLLREGIKLKMQSFSSCKYSNASIRNSESLVDKFYGSYKIQTIVKLLNLKKND